jgi:hypothetical protein
VTLYARADVSYVSVPTASGGCGVPHTRPVVNGAPAKQFVLNCQGCENYLRADIARSGGNKKVRTINGDTGLALKERYLGLWGASPDTVPETPDDELKREHDEQAMVTKNAASQTETLAQIGAAVAGNAELMGKFIELQLALAKNQQPTVPIPAAPVDQAELGKLPDPRLWEYPVGGMGSGLPAPIPDVDTSTWQQRLCTDCSTPIIRKEGQRGALPQRCPDCKAKKAAARRKAA